MEIQGNRFVCPRCGKTYRVDDSDILSIVTSSDVDMNRGYNPSWTKIVTKYQNIRFCKSCAKRLNINHYIRHICWFAVPLLLFLIITREIKFSVFAIPLGCSVFFHPLAITLYRDIKMKSSFTKDLINRAKNGNAII